MKTLIKNGLVLLWEDSGWKIEKKDILISGSRIESILNPDSNSSELCTFNSELS